MRQSRQVVQNQFDAKPQAVGRNKYRQKEQPVEQIVERREEQVARVYVESDEPVEELAPEHQYYFLDKPEAPVVYVPPPGVDKQTQIPRYDWDLHDFNLEVEPVLQSLVGRCLEQSRIELVEEHEETEFKRRRKQFEIRRHAELMKTQRMDEEHRRLQEEIKRRELQRTLYYKNKKETHKKLYSRVLAKNALEGIEEMTLQIMQDLDYFKDDVEDAVEGSFYDWLIDSTVAECRRRERIEEVVNTMRARVPTHIEDVHYQFLEKENKRLQKIKDDEEEKKRKFEEDRRNRRERRQLQRVARTKRRLKEEIEAKIYSKKAIEPDVLAIKLISISDEDTEAKKFRTYGGFLYEFWAVISFVRWAYYKRMETPMEKFLLDEDLKKFIVNFLSDANLKDKFVKIKFNEKYKGEFEQAIKLMENNLVSFNEQKETIISSLVEHPDLVVGLVNEYCISNNLLDMDVLQGIIRNILRIYFKSNDYKIPQEELLAQQQAEAARRAELNNPDNLNTTENPDQSVLNPPVVDVSQPADQSQMQGDLNQSQLQLQNGNTSLLAPPESTPGEGSFDASGRRPSFTTKRSPFPEVTEEDRKIEALKKKLDIEFVPEVEQIPHVNALFRIQESLNRDDIRPEVKAQREEEEERIRQEKAAIKDPKSEFNYHRRPYLHEEYLDSVKKREEEEKRLKEEEEQRQKDLYIEQYYGDAYEKELEIHDTDDVDRPATSLQEANPLNGDKKVLFIHSVDQTLYRQAIFSKLRETFKEMGLIKDLRVEKEIKPIDKKIEAMILEHLVTDKEEVPIFDVEL